MMNPYLAGLDLVKQHPGTGGQIALAKAILSIYNEEHSFSMGEILRPMDDRYAGVVLQMMSAYSAHGETEELRQVGQWVYRNFPNLIELSEAMQSAKTDVRKEWARQREQEAARSYPNG